MQCRRCGGSILYEFIRNDESILDLSCLHCGKRWCLRKSHPVARWVIERIGK